jgi:hypothetical protein
MLESPAYRVLSLSAHRLLSRLEIEMAHHGGTENGRLPCTFDDFVRYGLHRHAISPAIRETVALGFIEVTEEGCAGNAEHRSPNMFRLTFRNTDKDKPTNEWRRVSTLEEAERLAAAARKNRTKRSWRPKRKTNFSAGFRQVSVPETITETGKGPVPVSIITSPVSETITTLDISGENAVARAKRALEERRSELARYSEPNSLNGADGTVVRVTNGTTPRARLETNLLKSSGVI